MDEIVIVVLGTRRWEVGAMLCRSMHPGRVRPGEVVVWDVEESCTPECEVEGRWSWPEVRIVVVPSAANSSTGDICRLAKSVVKKKSSILFGVLMAVDESADESVSWKLGRELQSMNWQLGCVRFAIPTTRGDDNFDDDGRIEEAREEEEEKQFVVASMTTFEDGEKQAALEVCAAVARAAARDTTAHFASLPLDFLLFDANEPELQAIELPVVSRRRPRPREICSSRTLSPSIETFEDDTDSGITPLLKAAAQSSSTLAAEEDTFAETDQADEEPFWRHFIGESDEMTAGALARSGCVVCWRDTGHRLDRPYRVSLGLRDHAAEDQRLAVRSIRLGNSCDCSPFPPKPKNLQYIAHDDDSGERGGIVLRAIHRRCTPGRRGDWRDLDSGAAFPSLGAWLAALVADIPLREGLPGALLTKANRLFSAAKIRGIDSTSLPQLADALLTADFNVIDQQQSSSGVIATSLHEESSIFDDNDLINFIPTAFIQLEKKMDGHRPSRAALLAAFPAIWRQDATKLRELSSSVATTAG